MGQFLLNMLFPDMRLWPLKTGFSLMELGPVVQSTISSMELLVKNSLISPDYLDPWEARTTSGE